jgi:ribulose-phosphate 3-epimerase
VVKIAPSILAADFARLGEQVREAESAGADWIHVDVMDGRFVPNITVGPPVVAALRRVTSLPLDLHLMIEEPERYLAAFATAGADRITVHVETCPHLHSTLEQIRQLGMLPGVTLNPATPIGSLSEVLDQVALILVMTVEPGFGGQAFIPRSIERLRHLRQMLRAAGVSPEVEVDGGIDSETASRVVAAGATVLVAGTAIFGTQEGVAAAIRRLRESVYSTAASEASGLSR